MLHELALAVHSVLIFGHSLGAIYNFKRKNYWQTAIHFAAGGYDVWAANNHLKEIIKEVSHERNKSQPDRIALARNVELLRPLQTEDDYQRAYG